MMKLAIARNTVIEENPSEEIATAEDEKRYRKRLAVSETSIWFLKNTNLSFLWTYLLAKQSKNNNLL